MSGAVRIDSMTMTSGSSRSAARASHASDVVVAAAHFLRWLMKHVAALVDDVDLALGSVIT